MGSIVGKVPTTYMESFSDLLAMSASTSDNISYHRGNPLYVVYSLSGGRYTNLLRTHRTRRKAVKWCIETLHQSHAYHWTPDYQTIQKLRLPFKTVNISGPDEFSVVQRRTPHQVSVGLSKALATAHSVINDVHALYNKDDLNVWNLCLDREEALGFRRQYAPNYDQNSLVKRLSLFD